MPYQAFMPSPPAPVYFNLGLRDAAETYQKNALENRKLKALTEQNALTQQSAQEKLKREQEKFEEEKRKSGLAESEKVREWQAGIIAQSPYDQVDTPDKLGMKVGGVDKIHPDISNLFNQNPQQAYQAIKTKYGKQPEPVKPISLEEQYTDLEKREGIKATAKPGEIYGPVKQGLDETGKAIFFRVSKTDSSNIQIVKGVAPEPKKGMKIYDREGNLMVDTTGGSGTGGPMKLVDLTRLQHPKTGEPPPIGMTQEQALKEGYKVVSQSVEKQDVKLRSAEAVVGRIQSLAIKIWGGKDKKGKPISGVIDVEGGWDRITQAPKVWFEVLKQQPDISIFESSKKGFASLMMKALGEERVTDQDVERGYNLLPKVYPIPDRREVAERKLGQLFELFDEIARRPSKVAIPQRTETDLDKAADALIKRYGGE